MHRLLASMVLLFGLLLPAHAQDTATPPPAPVDSRAETGGAQTLEDILARQRGLKIDDSFRSDATGNPAAAAPTTAPLGTLGGASDPELWRAIRYGSADVRASNSGPAAGVLIQDRGMWWLDFRRGPLLDYALWGLGGTLALLALFYLLRGRIRIQGPKTGNKIERFKAIERFGHWLLASSFIILALTGLVSLFGRKVLIPAFGHGPFSTIAIATKWLHNNVSWAFMIALVMVFVFWVMHNLPDRTDLKWIAQGGGFIGKRHPPAKKFNAGQKLIFWSVIILGASISASGLSMLFPFELDMFGATFAHLNDLGAPGWFGYGDLPTQLSPQEEMQYAQLWHAIVSLVLIAIIFAHIYIGTLGMEGAFDAMGSGEVEEQWAREHHSLWVDEVKARENTPPAGATATAKEV